MEGWGRGQQGPWSARVHPHSRGGRPALTGHLADTAQSWSLRPGVDSAERQMVPKGEAGSLGAQKGLSDRSQDGAQPPHGTGGPWGPAHTRSRGRLLEGRRGFCLQGTAVLKHSTWVRGFWQELRAGRGAGALALVLIGILAPSGHTGLKRLHPLREPCFSFPLC